MGYLILKHVLFLLYLNETVLLCVSFYLSVYQYTDNTNVAYFMTFLNKNQPTFAEQIVNSPKIL